MNDPPTRPKRLSLRPHQTDCVEHAKMKNTIVCLPTGEGKTLIAVRLIEHYLERYPDKRVAFLVPTRPLVEQQSSYCMEHCRSEDNTTPKVQKLFGDAQSGWQENEWNQAIESHDIFLGTPAIFQKALVTDKYICVENFSLFVFDECHNAKGNSPMAAVLRDAISVSNAAAVADDSTLVPPRILGLTASIIHGNLKDMERKRQTLETLMNATVICPDVTTKLELKNYQRITYSQDSEQDQHKDMIEMHVRTSLEDTRLIKDVKKTILRCTHVFCELGVKPMFYYINQVILKQLHDRVTHLELQDDKHCERAARALRECIPNLEDDLVRLRESLATKITGTVTAIHSAKLNRLFGLLDNTFSLNEDGGYRGIIFVEQVALVSALAKHINDEFSSRFICGAIAGTGSQTEAARQEQLAAFKDGQVQVLVATAALEEGIDVAECKFVIRYNHIATTKGHIQGAGRARHPNAEIYYFENCPENERRSEAAMTAVARNESLSQSPEELQKANAGLRVYVEGRHPYPFGVNDNTEGEANVFNCKQLFVNYCSRVLGQSVSPEIELYDYFEDLPDSSLSSIRYPTNKGWQQVTCSRYMDFWAGVDLGKEVFNSDRVKSKSQQEREEMCFVYLVVVELREKGLLDMHNKPVEVKGFETRRMCPLRGDRPPTGFALKDSVFQSTAWTSQTQKSPRRVFAVDSVNGKKAKESIYPFAGEDGVAVTLGLAKTTLNEYNTFILSKTVSFKKLYEYEDSGQRKIVLALKIPSPDGWIFIRRDEYAKFCSEVDVEKIAGPGKKGKQREELCFAYLAVVELRKRGYLDSLNRPSASPAEAQEKCTLESDALPDQDEAAARIPPANDDAAEKWQHVDLPDHSSRFDNADSTVSREMPPVPEIVRSTESLDPSEMSSPSRSNI